MFLHCRGEHFVPITTLVGVQLTDPNAESNAILSANFFI